MSNAANASDRISYDLVPPGPAAAPTAGALAGQHDFRFDRVGVRVPTIAVSAWIPERTVVTREHWNTSIVPRSSRTTATVVQVRSFMLR
ncbi:hypothetical protein [Streptomyces phaeoluteigriseus]|uniref:hypothetical protein n=1 Tax=Streptomyces phaeoluteigriseus TaxID=114686 RepID=UPI0036964314